MKKLFVLLVVFLASCVNADAYGSGVIFGTTTPPSDIYLASKVTPTPSNATVVAEFSKQTSQAISATEAAGGIIRLEATRQAAQAVENAAAAAILATNEQQSRNAQATVDARLLSENATRSAREQQLHELALSGTSTAISNDAAATGTAIIYSAVSTAMVLTNTQNAITLVAAVHLQETLDHPATVTAGWMEQQADLRQFERGQASADLSNRLVNALMSIFVLIFGVGLWAVVEAGNKFAAARTRLENAKALEAENRASLIESRAGTVFVGQDANGFADYDLIGNQAAPGSIRMSPLAATRVSPAAVTAESVISNNLTNAIAIIQASINASQDPTSSIVLGWRSCHLSASTWSDAIQPLRKAGIIQTTPNVGTHVTIQWGSLGAVLHALETGQIQM